jgi:hypothetical protein
MSAEGPADPAVAGAPEGLTPQIIAFCEELRKEGVAVGTAEILDSFAALGTIPWRRRGEFREALAATLAKSQEDRRIFELIFDRYFFRAAEAEALERSVGAEADRFEGGERIDLDELRELIREAIAEGAENEMQDLARLAVAAFGQRGEGSGVVGVDVQRIRRSLGLQPGQSGPVAEQSLEETPALDRGSVRRFEGHLRKELEAHSASVGRRPPAARQKALASPQVTLTRGRSSFFPGPPSKAAITFLRLFDSDPKGVPLGFGGICTRAVFVNCW